MNDLLSMKEYIALLICLWLFLMASMLWGLDRPPRGPDGDGSDE